MHHMVVTGKRRLDAGSTRVEGRLHGLAQDHRMVVRAIAGREEQGQPAAPGRVDQRAQLCRVGV
jgi:hypothetical protein